MLEKSLKQPISDDFTTNEFIFFFRFFQG
jgi:hypothetical protein